MNPERLEVVSVKKGDVVIARFPEGCDPWDHDVQQSLEILKDKFNQAEVVATFGVEISVKRPTNNKEGKQR